MNKPVLKKDRINLLTFDEFKEFLLRFCPLTREWMDVGTRGWAFQECTRHKEVYGYQANFSDVLGDGTSISLKYYFEDKSVLVSNYPFSSLEIKTMEELTEFLQGKIKGQNNA